MAYLGVPLGILIGVVSGSVAIAFLYTLLHHMEDRKLKSLILITTELLALPTFWFGGPWIATELIESLEFGILLPYYVNSLALTFLSIFTYPLVQFIKKIVKRIEKKKHERIK